MIPNGARYIGLIVVNLDSLDGLIIWAGARVPNVHDELFSRREINLRGKQRIPPS